MFFPRHVKAAPAKTDNSLLPFDLPAVALKKVSTAFDGGLISLDGGLVLSYEAERRFRLTQTLADRIRSGATKHR